ncbi:hypothetical protein [Actinomadura sp. B10D3]|uniref:hypothetical protein n=1 Tax=Actinomadura sp. B10D3 TaxID=3153557 RepID=UPI00325CFD93
MNPLFRHARRSRDQVTVAAAMALAVGLLLGGVVGMAERARRAGGRLCLRSAPGRGTTVTVTVPYASRPAADASGAMEHAP